MKKYEKKLRFSIRKLAVGAASVVIGTTLFGVASQSQQVQADTTNTAVTTSSDSTTSSSTTSSEVKVDHLSVHLSDSEFAKVNDKDFFTSNDNGKKIAADFVNKIQTLNPDYTVKLSDDGTEVNIIKDGQTVKTLKIVEYLINEGPVANGTFVTPNTAKDDSLVVPVAVDKLTSLSSSEFDKVSDLIKSLNKEVESVSQSGSKVVVTFTDGSTKNLTNKDLVNEGWISTFNLTGSLNASATTVTLPETKVSVKDSSKLTDSEKDKIIAAIKEENSFTDGTTISVTDDGYVRVIFGNVTDGFAWVKPSDVLTVEGSATKVNGTVKVKKNTYVYTGKGKKTKTSVKKGSTWKTTAKKTINGKVYYQIGSTKKDQWLLGSAVTFTKAKAADKVTYPAYKATITIKKNSQKNLSLYDYKLKKVTTSLKNVSYLYTTNVKKVNGKVVAYRYKSNQWIKVSDVDKVTAGYKKPTSTSKDTTSNKTTYSVYAATVEVNSDVNNNIPLYDYKLSKVTAHLKASYVYTTYVKKVNGKVVAYRYKSNQWIKASDVDKVTKGHQAPSVKSNKDTKKTTSSKSTTTKKTSSKVKVATGFKASKENWVVGYPGAYLMDKNGKKIKSVKKGTKIEAIGVKGAATDPKRTWQLSDGSFIYAKYLMTTAQYNKTK
ncbi:YSIRK-type signal peptide-containing protein [Lactobacillus sp. PV037]|uniref:YSIRK-type signal peptide-containing protein n=1 Tax=unclassified Lactobacillus TaxID=2620435 RepID=UPI00223ED6E6|nr:MULTISPECIES: YSIRK-type signal peptide-containing protein [unclassified Lactobacillus]QNQ82410.1 YSIRK-type signal peptide-containing protein [Lactobacillus sp. PV012]QNQ84428.1 YSIRK-type signal peptide-containing protein [Lactobacillus sp. PV037]